jgi:hypothetical protein
MGFDWKAFATGFMETTAENIKERKAEAREYEERQTDLAERNLLTISKRRAVANQVVGLTNMLRENGASDTVIQAAIASGPKQVATLASKVDAARSRLGRNLSSADIETLIAVPDDFSPIDMSTEDFINRTYGLGYEGAGTTDTTIEQSFMDRLTGRRQMDMARARLDSKVMQDGLTAYDINQMAALQDYESLVPGTFVSFNELKVFDPATDMSDFTRTISSLVGDVQDSAAFNQIQTDIQQTTFSEDLDEDQKAVRIAELNKQRDALYLSTIAPTINSMVETYGESFVDSTEGYLRTFLSDSYVDSLLMQPETQEEAEEATTAEQTVSVLEEPAVASRIVTPEVTVSELPDAPRAEEVTIPQDAEDLPEPVEEPLEDGGFDPDDMSVALLQTNGTDIMDYLKAEGVTSEEEMAIAINEWAQQNSKTVPLDKSVLIYALKPYVLEQ